MNKWTTHEEEYNALVVNMQEIAGAHGYRLNPDTERIEKVLGLMTENFLNAGKNFCPCKQSHPLNPDTDVVCPCPQFHDEIKKDGNCFCKLFFTKD